MNLDAAARVFLGTIFRHQGRDPIFGIDCIGLIVLAGQLAGYAFPAFDRSDYGRDPAHGLLETYLQAAFGSPIPKADMAPGDIVAVDFKGAVRHVGIVAAHPDGLSLIHTNEAVGRVTEARIDSRWLGRIAAVYRPTK
jgi:cell wall-associated NlpC family hydrolase